MGTGLVVGSRQQRRSCTISGRMDAPWLTHWGAAGPSGGGVRKGQTCRHPRGWRVGRRACRDYLGRHGD